MKKVGRPPKYPDNISRIETRRKQNRENQRRCRRRMKLFKELTIIPKSNTQINKEYRYDLFQYTNQFDYDYYFTGTVDPNWIERQLLKEINQQITRENQEFEIEQMFQIEKKIGIKSLRKYTERFLRYLYEKNLFEHCFVVFELGENYKYHTHIMFKSNPDKKHFDLTSNDSWLLGNCKSVPVNSDEDKGIILEYFMKEMKPTSTKITDLNLIDNWFMWGNFLSYKPLKQSEQVNVTVPC